MKQMIDTTLMKAMVDATPTVTESFHARPLPPEHEQIPLNPINSSRPNPDRSIKPYGQPSSDPWYD